MFESTRGERHVTLGGAALVPATKQGTSSSAPTTRMPSGCASQRALATVAFSALVLAVRVVASHWLRASRVSFGAFSNNPASQRSLRSERWRPWP